VVRFCIGVWALALLLLAPAVAFAETNPSSRSPAASLGAGDCAWVELDLAERDGQCAIYDPVRDRMLVFGGIDRRNSSHFFNDVWALSLRGGPIWTALTPAGTPPNGLAEAKAIYDPVRDRMVVFGGDEMVRLAPNSYELVSRNDVWALSLAGTPMWTKLAPLGTPPGPCEQPSAIFDPLRDRMLVFGGTQNYDYLNDCWALSLSDTPTWTRLDPAGTRPVGRLGHSAIYDPPRDRMIVFGGYNAPVGLSDVWELRLSGPLSWNELSPTGTPPSIRGGHSAIFDPVGERMIVMGGGVDYPVSDTWALSLSGPPAWSAIVAGGTSPGPHGGHSAIYDPDSERMILFGGDGTSMISDTNVWALSLAGAEEWSLLLPAGPTPTGRLVRSAIYDPPRDRVLTFGGQDEAGEFNNDVWALPLSGQWPWTLLTPAGAPPSPRTNQSVIYDPARERMVLFGGCTISSYYKDVWTLDLAGPPAWQAMTPQGTAPSPRAGHVAIYDPVGDCMVVFGGLSGGSFVADVWTLSLSSPAAWTQLAPTGTAPHGRTDCTAIYDPVRTRMVVFGGRDGSLEYNDVWALSLAGTPTWTRLSPIITPPIPGSGDCAIYDPVQDRMVVVGGWTSDVWALTLGDSPAWTTLAPVGEPPPGRAVAPGIYDPYRNELVVLGGQTSSMQLLTDVWGLLLSGVTGRLDVEQTPLAPGHLRPPRPNPAPGNTVMSFSLARPGFVRITIYDVSGRLVRELVNGQRRAGVASVTWDGTNSSGARLGAGLYIVRFTASGIRESQRLVLLR
jgi:hypothetical protein